MATFGSLQTSVSKRLLDANNTAVSALDVAAALNDTIRHWKFTRFWFNEDVSTQTMTLQDGVIPLPSDFLVPATDDGGFVVSYSDQRYPLVKESQLSYDGHLLDNGYGLPRTYARTGGSYECYPLPDREYTVLVRYLKDYTTIEQSNANATNDFTDNAERLLILWTCANLIAELRQDQKMEGYYRTAALAEVSNLKLMTRKSNASGKLTLDSSLI